MPDGTAHSAKLVLDGKDISHLVRAVTISVSVEGEASAVIELAGFGMEVEGEMAVDLLP